MPEAVRVRGLPLRERNVAAAAEAALRMPGGGVPCSGTCTTPDDGKLRLGGGVVNGPGVVMGYFSTCNALMTTASRL